jgi:hypothetical protein
MRADRAAAGLSGAAILVVIALSPGGLAVMEAVLLVVAALVVLATFAPALPGLHRLPIVGEPRVEAILSFEGAVLTCEALRDGMTVFRVGFVNHGPHRVRDALINVVVSAGVEIEASDPRGRPLARGSLGPPTELDGKSANFWIDKDVALPVGATLLHYRLSVRNLGDLTGYITVRVAFHSDDFYGKRDRVCMRRERVIGFTPQVATHGRSPDDSPASQGSSGQHEAERDPGRERGEGEAPTHA